MKTGFLLQENTTTNYITTLLLFLQLLELRVAASTNSAAEQYIKLILPALYKNMRNFKLVRISEAVAELE